jgi:hypothetical protein
MLDEAPTDGSVCVISEETDGPYKPESAATLSTAFMSIT